MSNLIPGGHSIRTLRWQLSSWLSNLIEQRRSTLKREAQANAKDDILIARMRRDGALAIICTRRTQSQGGTQEIREAEAGTHTFRCLTR